MSATTGIPVLDGLMDAQSFGLRLRELRQRAGLSQTALGKAAGIPQTTIASWENGNREALVTAIPKLAAALGCTLDDLFADPETTPPKPKRGRPRKAE